MRVAVSSKNSFVGIMTSHVRVGVLKLRFIIPRMHAIIHRAGLLLKIPFPNVLISGAYYRA